MIDMDNPRIKQPILGKWNIKKKIGSGKHGVVYKAEDERGNIAAIKIISLPNDELLSTVEEMYGRDQGKIENFVGEIAQKFGNEVDSMQIVGRECDNIIKLYDNVAQQTGIYWDIIIVMEYAIPIKEYFKNNELRVVDVIDFAIGIAKGLEACERRNIIHRDIKEDNLFFGSESYEAKIGDFGVSTINESGLGSTIGMGTPYYMAPEVTMNKRYDATVDIYSLGIVLYKMLNGNRFPFVKGVGDYSELSEALERRKKGESLPPPQYAPKELADIVLTCCEYDPYNRFVDGKALYRALKTVKSSMSEQDLQEILPYLYKKDGKVSGGKVSGGKGTDGKDTGGKGSVRKGTGGKGSGGDGTGGTGGTLGLLMSTISIIQSIINKEGRGSTIARGFTEVIKGWDIENHKKQVYEAKKKQKSRIIVLVSIAIVSLMAILVMLYPKTATFYIDPSDNDRIHVKYLFLPDRRCYDTAASYLNVEGNWMYYSNPEEDHSLYKLSIWGGEPELLCTDDCEYDILIGDYIYFTSYDEGEILCRIKTDGTGKQVVLNYACRDLKRNGNNIMFVLADTGELMELDTTTIN